jgi:hypothetical protein
VHYPISRSSKRPDSLFPLECLASPCKSHVQVTFQVEWELDCRSTSWRTAIEENAAQPDDLIPMPGSPARVERETDASMDSPTATDRQWGTAHGRVARICEIREFGAF